MNLPNKRRIPTLPAALSALFLTGCGTGSGGPSGAARMTFVVFLLFVAGTFFINRDSTNFLRNARFTAFLDQHIRKLYTGVFASGAAVALVSLAIAIVVGNGATAEAVCIGLIIAGLCLVLASFCLKRWEETHGELWLRRVIQMLYIGVICCSAIAYFIRGV